jgi:hypothetical protein
MEINEEMDLSIVKQQNLLYYLMFWDGKHPSGVFKPILNLKK